MFLRNFRVIAPVAGLAALLSACGGGGSSKPPPPANSAPVLTTTTLAATEDTQFTAQLAATDAEGNAITFARVNDGQHGVVTITAAGAVTYTPAANYSGSDTFNVRLTDGVSSGRTTAVTVTVAAVNDLPVFTPPALSTDEDVDLNSQLNISATDVDGNALTFSVTTAPAHGTLTLSAAGAAVYTPTGNYNGADSFAVRVSDGAGGEANGTVAINIAAVNDAPLLTTTQLSVAEDGVLTAQLASTDVENQAVLYQVGSGAAHGQVSISPSGLLTYTPNADYFGSDALMVGVTDDQVTLTLRPLTIAVNPVNDAPVAYEDLLRLPANAIVTLPVLANDSDVDGDHLTVTILSQPGGGTLAVNSSNEITFTRDNQFNGPIRFSYRVTDAAGVTAEADVRAVIGDFPGIYYLSDETTVGQLEVHWFDGLRVYRLGTDLDAGDEITSFGVAADGQTVAYVVENANVTRVFVTGPSASDSRVVFTSAAKPASAPPFPRVMVNRNGTYLMVVDPYVTVGGVAYVVRTSDGLQTRVGTSTPTASRFANFVFNPANDDFYLQAQVGGSPPPMSGTGYLTLFRGSSTSAGNLTQVGQVYPTPSNGGGSGIEIAITADGRYVLHEEITYSPLRGSVLVYDSLNNTEAPVYRRPVASEIGMWNGFSVSNDGSQVCFKFVEPGTSGTAGPARFVAGSPGEPAAAGPVTPVVDFGYQCRFGSDNHTVFYSAATAAEPRGQIYSVDAGAPGTPAIVNRPLVAGEQINSWWVARDSPRLAFGTNTAGVVSYYSVSLDTPGTFIPFATNVFDDGNLPAELDRNGFVLAFTKRPAPLSGLPRLTLLSTQSANYSFSLTRPETTTGLIQYQWAP